MSHDSSGSGEMNEIRQTLASLTSRLTRVEHVLGIKFPAAFEKPDPPVVTATPVSSGPLRTANQMQEVAIVDDVPDAAPPVSGSESVRESPLPQPTPIDRWVAHALAPRTDRSETATASKASRKPVSMENLIGGRVFTWAGGILLVLAAAFFVVWSWRHLEISPLGKVVFLHTLGIGGLIAGCLLGRRDLPGHSRVLYGVGVFTLYASALAMTHLYKIGGDLAMTFGFVDGVVITAVAILIAVRLNSPGMILLGAFGGYLTPILTIGGFRAGEDDAIALVYLALLNVALLVSASFRRWAFIKSLAWFATATLLAVWLASSPYVRWYGAQARALLVVHALIFVGLFTILHLIRRTRSDRAENALLTLTTMGLLGGYGWICRFAGTEMMCLSFALAGGYGLIAWFGFRRLDATDRLPRIALALGCALVTLAITIALRDFPDTWSSVWAIEAVMFALTGYAFCDRQMLFTAIIAFGLSWLRLIAADAEFPAPLAWLDPIVLRWGFLAVCTAIAGSGWWWVPVRQYGPAKSIKAGTQSTKTIRDFLLASANLLLMVTTVVQWLPAWDWIVVVWTVHMAVLWTVGLRQPWTGTLRFAAVLIIGVLGVASMALASDIWSAGVANWDWPARLAVLAPGLLWLTAGRGLWQHNAQLPTESERHLNTLLTAMGHIVLLHGLTAELWHQFASYDLIVIAWTIYTAVVWAVHYRGDREDVLRFATVLVIALPAIGGFGLCLHDSESLAERWDLASRLAMLLPAVLWLSTGWLYWKRRDQLPTEFEQSWHAVLTVMGHLMLLVAITCEICFQFGGAAVWSTRQMAAVSVAWGLYASAVIASGFAMRYRVNRIFGITLFVIVLAKVFLADLSQFELIIRVIALFILGLLLLGVSYLYQKYKTRIGLGD